MRHTQHLKLAVALLILAGCTGIKRDLRIECEGWCLLKADTDIEGIDPTDAAKGGKGKAAGKLRDKILIEPQKDD